MDIAFDKSRFERIRRRYDSWWRGESESPIAGAMIAEREAGEKPSVYRQLTQATVDLDTPADAWLNAIEYDLSRFNFYGDAYPRFNLDCFGPGIVAAFLGADLENGTGQVWFRRKEYVPIEKLDFEVDKDNVWLKRVLEFCGKATERFQGKILFGMPDMGGIMDILSTFFPGEELLLALYDSPEDVKRLCRKIEECWNVYYDMIAERLNSKEYGYTDWSGIYSSKPSYITQCDFSYMISSDMFEEFALEGLRAQSDRLFNTIYHLDGEGELKHLNHLLSIDSLKAVQWVPGSNGKKPTEYTDVYRKILDAGKNVQLLCYYPEDQLNILSDTGAKGKAMMMIGQYGVEDKRKIMEMLKEMGVEV